MVSGAARQESGVGSQESEASLPAPDSWLPSPLRRPIRAVITADNHLSRGHSKMSPQKLEMRRRYLRNGFKAAVDYAIESEADLFLQAGDLFDSPQPRNVDRAFVAHELRRLAAAGVRIFGIAGTHDSPRMMTIEGGTTPQRIYEQFEAMHMFNGFDDPTPVTVDVEGVSVAIGGVSFNPVLMASDDPLAGIEFPRSADIGIMLVHYSVEGACYDESNEPVVSKAAINSLEGVDLLVAGHYHDFRQFGIGRIKVLIPGATERMIYGAEREASFAYVELLPGKADRIQKVVVDGQDYRPVTVRTTELDEREPFESACARLETAVSPEAVVKVTLEGPLTRDMYRGLRLRELLQWGSNHCFHFEIDSSGLALLDERLESAGKGVRLSLREEMSLVAQQLIEQEPEHREALEKARQELLLAYE
ncbi:MAG TPA: metallophosphoesterase [Chloroflexota bacterium]|nr:metallophosphoesterase [Chloroflexota bacterium]